MLLMKIAVLQSLHPSALPTPEKGHAIWTQFKNVKDLTFTKFKELANLSSEADRKSRNCLKHDSEWNAYREDISQNQFGRPAPGNATELGRFTYTRDQQLTIPKYQKDSSPENDRTDDSQSMPSDTMSLERQLSQETDLSSGSHPSESTGPLSKVMTKVSDQSAAGPNIEGSHPPSPGEDYVNVAALSFLRTLTMRCPGVRLDWDVTSTISPSDLVLPPSMLSQMADSVPGS